MSRATMRWGLVVAGVLLAGVAAVSAASRGLSVGKQPPQFSAPDMTGTTYSLEAARGKIVVLHFWATWCPYCRAEVPKLKQIQSRWGGKEVQILAVSVDQELPTLQHFVTEQHLPYPVLWEQHAEDVLSELYAVVGLPSTYLIGRDGVIVNRFAGAADLVPAVERAVGH
jgi:peroxiredoxin